MSDELMDRINSVPAFVNDAVLAARATLRDECLFLAAQCRRLAIDNEALTERNAALSARVAAATEELRQCGRSRGAS